MTNIETAAERAANDAAAFLFGVQKYCRDNYNNGWCDFVVETLEDHELAAIIKGSRTLQGAIRKARSHFGGISEHRRSVQNEMLDDFNYVGSRHHY